MTYLNPLDLENSLEELEKTGNLPERPISKKDRRVTLTIHWDWTTTLTDEEMAKRLGVQPSAIQKYKQETPSQEVQELMDVSQAEVRGMAVHELREQLRTCGQLSKTATSQDSVFVDESGNIVHEWTVPDDPEASVREVYGWDQEVRLLPDEERRWMRRSEVREILDMLLDITGAREPIQVETSHSVDLEELEHAREELGDLL